MLLKMLNRSLIKSFPIYRMFPLVCAPSRNINNSSVLKDSNQLNAVTKEKLKRFNENDVDTWVGPPHPVSNLRLKVFPNSKNLTEEEQHFYDKSREIQDWNQQYWELHNKDFLECRSFYTKELSRKKGFGPEYTLTNEEMSDFYRQFLNKNYEKHVSYNWQWYRRNFHLIYLSAKAQLSRIKRLIKKESS